MFRKTQKILIHTRTRGNILSSKPRRILTYVRMYSTYVLVNMQTHTYSTYVHICTGTYVRITHIHTYICTYVRMAQMYVCTLHRHTQTECEF